MPTPPPGAIEAATTGLLAFVTGACHGPVRLGVPVDADEAALWLWPYELVAEQQTNGAGARLPYRFAIRYLVAGTGVAALGLLDEVLAASVRAGQPQLVLAAPPPALWRALSLAPRPVLGFHVPASIAYPVGTSTLVRGSLQVKPLDLAPLTGSVLGTGDVPVAGARVEVAGTRLATHTGSRGQFRFPAVPDGGPLVLHIHARGRIFTARLDAPAGQPVTVHCDFTSAADPTVHATAADSG
jgi:Carboxypeptidase regulatory-like domain